MKVALLPICEESVREDNTFYHSLDVNDGSPPASSVQQFHADLIEMKNFMVGKLIELMHICNDEHNIHQIVGIFEKVLFTF